MFKLSTIILFGQSANLEMKHPKLKCHEDSQTSIQVTLGLRQRCRLVIRFRLHCQRAKCPSHYVSLGRVHTISLSEVKEVTTTPMVTCVVDPVSKEMKLANLSAKLSPFRIYSQNESMTHSIVILKKNHTVIYYSNWSPWCNALGKRRLHSASQHCLKTSQMWKPFSGTPFSWICKSIYRKSKYGYLTEQQLKHRPSYIYGYL